MNKYVKNLHNNIDFIFRKNIRFSRKYTAKNESKIELFTHLPCLQRDLTAQKEQEYLEKYQLQDLKNNSTKRIYLENLALIEILEHSFSDIITDNEINVLDIGSKNWFYAYGQYSFFKYCGFEKNIALTGIEIDGYRIYADFHSRYDYAQYYIRNLKNTHYLVQDFLSHTGKYDFITWFFPFVTEFPLLEWGLPLNTFKPEKMLLHAYNSLKPGGKLLIINQDENEYNIQKKIIKRLNIPYRKKGVFKNTFLEYEHSRFMTIISN